MSKASDIGRLGRGGWARHLDMRGGSTPIDKYPTSPVTNPANDTNNRVEIHEVQRALH